jgi:beta-galactosidase/beta-glucuronidase
MTCNCSPSVTWRKRAFASNFRWPAQCPAALPPLTLRYRLRSADDWAELPLQAKLTGNQVRALAPLKDANLWSPAEPNLYELELRVGEDRLLTRGGFRTVEVFGPQLRLNGQPLQVRGVLNWGYSAPRTEPNLGEAVWRREINLARARTVSI